MAYTGCNLRGKQGDFKYSTFSPEAEEKLRVDKPYLMQDIADIEAPKYGKFAQYIKNVQDGYAAGFKYFDIKDLTAINIVLRGDAGIISASVVPDDEQLEK